MSPRAAWRLESMGFRQVYEYSGGKADWASAGLPMEGELTTVIRVGDLVDRSVPTCSVTERVGDVRDRVREAGWDLCVVVNEEGVILGVLRRKALDADPDAKVEEVMSPGPATFRPNVSCLEMADYMRKHGIRGALVSDGDGRLIGFLRLQDCLRREAELRPLERLGQWPVKGW